MHTTRHGIPAWQIQEALIGEYNIELQPRYSKLGFTNKATRQRQSIFSSCLISISLSDHFYHWQTKTNLGSDHLPILISLQMDFKPIPHHTSFSLKKTHLAQYRKKIEDKLNKSRLSTNCQKGEKNRVYHHSGNRIPTYIIWTTPY